MQLCLNEENIAVMTIIDLNGLTQESNKPNIEIYRCDDLYLLILGSSNTSYMYILYKIVLG